MPKIVKVVLTGGPAGGKTAVLGALEYQFGGNLIVIPEVATQVLAIPIDGGGPGLPINGNWTQEWQDRLQDMIFRKQLDDEITHYKSAQERSNDTLIVCDRGLLDGAAYLSGGREEFLQRYGLSLDRCFGAYDMVLHLTSLAVSNPDLYRQLWESNPQRFENDPEWANQLDRNVLRAWEGHPQHIKVEATESIEAKIELCLREVRKTFDLNKELRPELIVETSTENNRPL